MYNGEYFNINTESSSLRHKDGVYNKVVGVSDLGDPSRYFLDGVQETHYSKDWYFEDRSNEYHYNIEETEEEEYY